MSLTTTRRLHALLGLPLGVTFFDSALDIVRDAANARVMRHLGQSSMGLLTRTEYPTIYGQTAYRIVLERAPVASIVAVTNGGSALSANDYRLTPETGYLDLVQGTIGSRTYLAAWSEIPGDVAVTYLHGFTDQNVPEELRVAADLIGAHMFRRFKHAGLNAETIGKHRVELSSLPMPPEATEILSAYGNAGG